MFFSTFYVLLTNHGTTVFIAITQRGIRSYGQADIHNLFFQSVILVVAKLYKILLILVDFWCNFLWSQVLLLSFHCCLHLGCRVFHSPFSENITIEIIYKQDFENNT